MRADIPYKKTPPPTNVLTSTKELNHLLIPFSKVGPINISTSKFSKSVTINPNPTNQYSDNFLHLTNIKVSNGRYVNANQAEK